MIAGMPRSALESAVRAVDWHQLQSTYESGDMALVAVSAAFPAEAKAVTAQLHDWFDRATPPLRTALGLALGFHGLVDEAVAEIVVDEVGQSNTWVTRSGGLICFTPNDSPFP